MTINIIFVFGFLYLIRLAYYRLYIRRHPNSNLALKGEAKKLVRDAKKFNNTFKAIVEQMRGNYQ